MEKLQLWGGPEYTVNRVQDRVFDQLTLSGHEDRIDDLDAFANLGLSALRYPVLWERVAPDAPSRHDWDWTDQRLGRLRQSGIEVIAGLLHHGSGPRYTNLLDPEFPDKFAHFAAAAATRYPWVRDWTPINEPLTTARFSALYGHWYPHRTDERSFWLALLNQVDGTRLAMREIRRINPAARLIQTDDLGRTYATAALRDQAGFDNLRRWAGWDLLFGRLDRSHPLWPRLAAFGLESRLQAIVDIPCPPDIVGVNHYLTSDRFLDHRIRRYPPGTRGGSDAVRYADVEAIRVLDPPAPGLAGVLPEAWDRYHTPIAVTEVHNGCTREEQMRWTAQAWDVAVQLRSEGVDIRAVTAWSLLGCSNWNTLLTGQGLSEEGAFDISSGRPRATAMAPLLAGLTDGAPRHPAQGGPGWWQRPIRLLHPPVPRPAPVADHVRAGRVVGPSAPPLLICGATGTLGQAFARACVHRGIHHVLTSRADMDLGDPRSIAQALDTHQPWAVMNATGWVRVDDAESDPDGCFAVNFASASALAAACGERDIATMTFSSDLVFDGRSDRPYLEEDAPNPLNVYGRSKVAMEQALTSMDGSHLVARTAAFFSPFDDHNFAVAVARTLAAGDPFEAIEDEVVAPAYVPMLVDRSLDLLIDGETGLWHLAGNDAVSWADFARRVAHACDLDERLVRGIEGAALGRPAPRPGYSALGSSRGAGLGPIERTIDRFAAEFALAVPRPA